MELPIPQLTTLETITVVFLCFVAAQVVLWSVKRQRIKEAEQDFQDSFDGNPRVYATPAQDEAAAASLEQARARAYTQRQHANGDVEYISRDGSPNLIVTAASQPKYAPIPDFVPIPEDWTPEQIANFQSYYDLILSDRAASQPKCPTPPQGWDCSRDIGHPGPCAASPSKSSASEGEAS